LRKIRQKYQSVSRTQILSVLAPKTPSDNVMRHKTDGSPDNSATADDTIVPWTIFAFFKIQRTEHQKKTGKNKIKSANIKHSAKEGDLQKRRKRADKKKYLRHTKPASKKPGT